MRMNVWKREGRSVLQAPYGKAFEEQSFKESMLSLFAMSDMYEDNMM